MVIIQRSIFHFFSYNSHREDGYPVLVNSPQETENVLRVAQKNNFSTATGDRIKASEDFSYYLLKKPGNFFVIGGVFKLNKNYSSLSNL